MKYVLDTDSLSLLQRSNTESRTLQLRLSTVPASDIATTIVTYEEQMRGWLAFAAKQSTPDHVVLGYHRLQFHIETFYDVPLLPFDDAASEVFTALRQANVRIGTMDLRIAAIALCAESTLITRNLRDFMKVRNLVAEDWSR